MGEKKRFVVSRELSYGQSVVIEATSDDDAARIARDLEDNQWETSDSFVIDNHYNSEEVSDG
mgnify:CR=1 FL=1|jgi:hypothetical protein